jgi:hypothetical protein
MTPEFRRMPRSVFLKQNSSPDSGANNPLPHTQEEHFVDAGVASAFLSITRKYLLKLSRLGLVPAHPLGIGSRRQWRYRISELSAWALAQSADRPDNANGSPRVQKRKNQ